MNIIPKNSKRKPEKLKSINMLASPESILTPAIRKTRAAHSAKKGILQHANEDESTMKTDRCRLFITYQEMGNVDWW